MNFGLLFSTFEKSKQSFELKYNLSVSDNTLCVTQLDEAIWTAPVVICILYESRFKIGPLCNCHRQTFSLVLGWLNVHSVDICILILLISRQRLVAKANYKRRDGPNSGHSPRYSTPGGLLAQTAATLSWLWGQWCVYTFFYLELTWFLWAIDRGA